MCQNEEDISWKTNWRRFPAVDEETAIYEENRLEISNILRCFWLQRDQILNFSLENLFSCSES